ncbi:MAG: hypothetical protein GQ566_01230 [Methanosarcinales archaeon]|nr:hypothetical protein [Methanosarcinales archaeon]
MIVVEGHSDKALVTDMGFPEKQIKIGSGKGKVLESVNKNQATIGIIDEDPYSVQPSDLKKYIEKDSRRTIKLLARKDDDSKRLIQISPRLEDWLYSRARQNQIDPRSFGLPKYPEDLHNILRVDKKENFHRFLNELIKVDDEMGTLKKWISEVI